MEKAKDNGTYIKKDISKGKKGLEERLSYKIINSIMKHKNKKMFEWISNHQNLSMSFIVLWGMLILIIFLWFIFTRFPP
jgi:hypothetical protein